ncbi:MAG: nucleoside recognition domain-containing protein [Chthoniobacteraceae bacterium]
MLNGIWLALILVAVTCAALTGTMPKVTDSAITAAGTAITLAIGLSGVMALWLGMMRLAEKSGLVTLLSRFLRPLLTRLFPEVPAEHPAMGAMAMNMAANMLGLGNAATPLGIRAMQNLATLNRYPGTASNSMCTFLAINTSSIQLIPATAVAILASAGSKEPTAIVGTAFLATLCAFTVAISSVKFLEKLPWFRIKEAAQEIQASDGPVTEALPEEPPIAPWNGWKALALLVFFGLMIYAALNLLPGDTKQTLPDFITQASPKTLLIHFADTISKLAIPLLLAFFPLYATLRGVAVYEEFVEGAKEGFQVAIRIMPFLVGMLVAIGMLRGSGVIDLVQGWLKPALDLIHFPPELVPLVLMRPLSGGGATGIFAELVKTFGPDNLITRTAGTIIGSTETTFYVLAVYFGAVAIKRARHAVIAGLLADLTGIAASVAICRLVFS